MEVDHRSIFDFDMYDQFDKSKDACYALFHEYEEKYKHFNASIRTVSSDSTKAFSITLISSEGMDYTK